MRFLSFFVILLSVFVFNVNISYANDIVIGDYIVLFKTIQGNPENNISDNILEPMLREQMKHLISEYKAEIVSIYVEISRTNGKGMFHIRIQDAIQNIESHNAIKQKLEQDKEIESVSNNQIMMLPKLPK